MSKLVPVEIIAGKILDIRGRKVMLDKDLAYIYGVSTKRLNEQVRRNLKRFPEDFILWQFERSVMPKADPPLAEIILPGILGCKSLCSNSPSMFQVTKEEYLKYQDGTSSLRSQIATSKRGGRRYTQIIGTGLLDSHKQT